MIYARAVRVPGWLVATAAVASATSARANPLEVLGLTSRHAAQANAGVASVDDAAALYYDPAGLVASPGKELSLGTIGAYSKLDDADLHDRLGVQLTMRAPLPLAGPLKGRIVVGIALHLLPHEVTRIISPSPDQPFYPYFSDRLSRIVVLPGAAVRLTDRIAIGGAVDVLAGLTGTIAAGEGATRALDPAVDERVGTIARVILGGTVQATECLRFGAVYREKFEVPFHTKATTLVAGEPLDLDVSAAGLFTPHELVAGVAYARPGFVASLDLGWQMWSGYGGPYVKVDSDLPLVGEVPGQAPVVAFSDTYSIRAGIETRRNDDGLILRGGYAFETTGVPDLSAQMGTMLVDGPHHTLAAGAGWQLGRFRFDAHVQTQIVVGHGELFSGGMTVAVGL